MNPKKINSVIALLLLTVTFNGYNMETQPIIEQEQPSLLDYTEYIAEILLGNIQFRQDESSPLEILPPEVKSTIITLLLLNRTTNSLDNIGKIVNALAQVNTTLYTLINNSDFCSKLIKHLAQEFDCSDEVVAMALKTEEAQNRLSIQKLFEILINEEKFDEIEFDRLLLMHKNYVDLNFTYKCSSATDFKRTLLLIAAQNIKKDGTDKLEWLLNKPGVNVNYSDAFGITTLMKCAIMAPPHIVALLCNYPAININQKNNGGETALMILCHFSGTPLFNIENMKILIDAGADPEITNTLGYSLLQAVERHGNQAAINLIKQALEKKYEKK